MSKKTPAPGPRKAAMALEDGTFFEGLSFGAEGERAGELCFNTSMTGYQEVLTDPSYKGQIVVMTYPHIGSYGITREDMESRKPFLEAFVVREAVKVPSNWQSVESIDAYLKREGIVGIEGVDTRGLTRVLREKGALRCVVSTLDLDKKSLVRKARAAAPMVGSDFVKDVTTARAYEAGAGEEWRVVAVDFGIKRGMVRCLAELGANVTVVPATTPASDILALRPDGILLSNGPGDPAALGYAIDTVRRLAHSGVPIFGICLGHQLLGLAFGAKSYKLKFGHRGANHPVLDVETGKILVTTHNHGFAIDEASLPSGLKVTHRSLNDRALEGFAHATLPVFTMQFHPEAAAGPHDARPAFERFKDLALRRAAVPGGKS